MFREVGYGVGLVEILGAVRVIFALQAAKRLRF